MNHNQFNSPWTKEKIKFLIINYPEKGKKWCEAALKMSEQQIRYKASMLNLKQNRDSDFFKDWQNRAAKSKIGKKRPEQALVIKKVIHDKGLSKPSAELKIQIGLRIKKYIKENGHPKGMLGIKHSDLSKEKMSISGLRIQSMKSDKEKLDRAIKMVKTKIEKGNLINIRPKATWKAGWREFGGKKKYYRSAWEANYGRYLEWLKENKKIIEWHHEPKTFWFEGIKRGCMTYLPDFQVIENNGHIDYHEVKGWMDDRSKTKISRMAKYYPEINLIIIDSKVYKSISKKVSKIINGWEA